MQLSAQLWRVIRIGGLAAGSAVTYKHTHQIALTGAVGLIEAAYRQVVPVKDQTKVSVFWGNLKRAYRVVTTDAPVIEKAAEQVDPGVAKVESEVKQAVEEAPTSNGSTVAGLGPAPQVETVSGGLGSNNGPASPAPETHMSGTGDVPPGGNG